jgi:hypothetical protein
VLLLLCTKGGTRRCCAGRSAPDMPGSVRSFHFPLNDESLEYPALAGPVTRMRLSHDDTMLCVAGDDGSIVVFEVCGVSRVGRCHWRRTHPHVRRPTRMPTRDSPLLSWQVRPPHREIVSSMPWSNETLVTRSDLEERAAAIAELRDAVEELQVLPLCLRPCHGAASACTSGCGMA